MTELDQMKAAVANLKTSMTGVSQDQVSSIVTQANAPLIAQLTTVISSEKDDAAKIADVQAAVDYFTAQFAPATPATHAPDATPVADATPAPTTPPATPVATPSTSAAS